ncbi:MAG: hypothetical protein COA65_08630 [Rhodospirillaceae bacterium]|nr:MAG: hypothetical protein COA65_08630 [Rhodospirillaceae bacterium]
MKTKHTEGKWGIVDRSGKIIIATNADDPAKQNNITSLYGYAEDEEVKANAKLMAAAPEMLKTLIDMVEMESTPDHIKKYAKEAIKEATPQGFC